MRDAIAEIVRRHPLIAGGRTLVIARNGEYVTADEPLADGDEVALIPPVSGGSFRLTPEPLDVAAALREVSSPDAGGIASLVCGGGDLR